MSVVPALILVIAVLAGCASRSAPRGATLDSEGRQVADTFTKAVFSGDAETAERLDIDEDSPNLRDFVRDNAGDDLRLAGPPHVSSNRLTYEITGRELGEFPARVRATFRVWMIEIEAGWRVSDWWYHIERRTFLDNEATLTSLSQKGNLSRFPPLLE